MIKATDNLVRAAQQAIEGEEEHTLRLNRSMVDGMAQEINARSEVLRMERELEHARSKLTAIRQAKYSAKKAGFYSDGSMESGDEGGYHSFAGYQTPSPNHLSVS